MTDTVTISLEVADLVDRAFLPMNPNKLRRGNPELVAAAAEFKRLVAEARLASDKRENEKTRKRDNEKDSGK